MPPEEPTAATAKDASSHAAAFVEISTFKYTTKGRDAMFDFYDFLESTASNSALTKDLDSSSATQRRALQRTACSHLDAYNSCRK